MTRGTKRALTMALLCIGVSCEPAATTPNTMGCRYQGWAGQCVLTDIRTTRMIQRPPQTFVVVEGTYEPRGAPGEYVPPPFKKEAFAAAAYERLLTEHLATYRTVQCSVFEAGNDPCAPKMTANVPEFLPPRVGAAAGPQGCAKLERMESSAMSSSPIVLPGPFQFDVGTAEISVEGRQLAEQAAAKILSDAEIECVAIKGKTAPGEDFSLANERAQAVKRLLQGRGIDHTRLTVFEATAPTHTAAPTDEQPVASEQRRAFLTVVIYNTGAAP